jgi:hypothetical protein
MALDAPNDRILLNAVSHYEREIPGRLLTVAQLARVAETAKRMILDEIHSAKAIR